MIQIIGIEGLGKDEIKRAHSLIESNQKKLSRMNGKFGKLEVFVKPYSIDDKKSYSAQVSLRAKNGKVQECSDSAFDPMRALQKAFDKMYTMVMSKDIPSQKSFRKAQKIHTRI